MVFMTVVVWATAVPQTQAQDESLLWSVPRLVSNPGVNNTSATEMVPDPHGFVHVFWSELNPEDASMTIQYATFDGVVWTEPNDLVITPPGVKIPSFSPALGPDGVLHLVWNENNLGPLHYKSAPALEAGSANAWERKPSLVVPAYQARLAVDSKNTLHLMYVNFYAQEPGIYYTRSTDQADTWSQVEWLDPDIPTFATPSALNFLIDDKDGLHASWFYAATKLDSPLGIWIRYSHSLDGGNTWSAPFTIDEADDSEEELRQPEPGLVISGDTVHVVYAGTADVEREHRYSLDRGVTWSSTKRVLDGLLGQAIGDGFAVDSLGRIHFFGQLRWPQGVFHAYWDPANPDAGWSTPQMAYVIAENSEIGRRGRYHSHRLRGSIINGNVLLVTFTDEATGPTYAIWRKLDDVPKIEPLSLPTIAPTPVATATPLPDATPTPTRPPFAGTDLATPEAPTNVGLGVWVGVVPALLLLFGLLGFRFYQMHNS